MLKLQKLYLIQKQRFFIMILALGFQTRFFWQLRYPGLGTLATSGEKKHRDACRSTRKMRCCHRALPISPAAATRRHANHRDRISAPLTDDARDLVNAAQVMLTGEQQDFATCVSHGGCTSQPRKVSPHGHCQAGAQDSFDRACNEAEKCSSNL